MTRPKEQTDDKTVVSFLMIAGIISFAIVIGLIIYAIVFPPSKAELAEAHHEDAARAARDAVNRRLENNVQKIIIQKKLWNTNAKFDKTAILNNSNEIYQPFQDALDNGLTSFDELENASSDFSVVKTLHIKGDQYQARIAADVILVWKHGIYPVRKTLINDILIVTFQKNNGQIVIRSVR